MYKKLILDIIFYFVNILLIFERPQTLTNSVFLDSVKFLVILFIPFVIFRYPFKLLRDKGITNKNLLFYFFIFQIISFVMLIILVISNSFIIMGYYFAVLIMLYTTSPNSKKLVNVFASIGHLGIFVSFAKIQTFIGEHDLAISLFIAFFYFLVLAFFKNYILNYNYIKFKKELEMLNKVLYLHYCRIIGLAIIIAAQYNYY